MKRKTRAMEIARITSQPDEDWMTPLAGNLTDASEAFSASFSTSFWIGIRSTPFARRNLVQLPSPPNDECTDCRRLF